VNGAVVVGGVEVADVDFSLLALVGLSTVNTIDFDGDGKDDT